MAHTAYFSAEIGFSSQVPTYSGGLGVLAGDHLKAAADAGLPLVGITLLYRHGYFRQAIGPDGWQQEAYPPFTPAPLIEPLEPRVEVTLRGRRVQVALWRLELTGARGHRVPILFLDTDVDGNHADDRGITHHLYGGDQQTRLLQEAVLGFAGMAAVRQLYPDVQRHHLNEGHCAFAALVPLLAGTPQPTVRTAFHFTTHTPVPAGHDVFPYGLAEAVLGPLLPAHIQALAGHDGLSMTELALSLSGSCNGVSALHGEVTRAMFPGRDIGHITNGVHHLTWTSAPMAALFDRELPGWRCEPELLAGATALSTEGVGAAHAAAKRALVEYVNSDAQVGLAPQLLTLGFARRFATYKRAHLLFADVERLVRICGGRVQLVFAGKAHPRDEAGHRLIQGIVERSNSLGGRLRIAFVNNYNMYSGALITAGVDVWLNTPLRPYEASGTSGMKAALNGVPSASIADGWWAEGADDGRNGWVIGRPEAANDAADAESLYSCLEQRIIPWFFGSAPARAAVMRQAIATGARFTAARMLQEYAARYYRRD